MVVFYIVAQYPSTINDNGETPQDFKEDPWMYKVTLDEETIAKYGKTPHQLSLAQAKAFINEYVNNNNISDYVIKNTKEIHFYIHCEENCEKNDNI